MFITPAFAQTAGGNGAASGLSTILMMGLLFVVFYFFLIRPQQKRAKEHRTKIDAVKKGDQVITGGGLVGKVIKVDEVYADIELGQGVKVRAVKATITDVLTSPTAAPAND